MHPRDAEALARFGGLFGGGRRFHNEPPPYEAVPLDDAFRGSDPGLKDFKTLGDLRKSYLATKAMVGGSIRVPAPEAPPEAHAEFRGKLRAAVPDLVEIPKDPEKRKTVEADIWKTLGRPEDEKGYTPDGVQFEEGVKLSDEELGKLRQVAKKRGYTTAQFKSLLEDVGVERAGALKAAKENQAALRAEFGAAYAEKMKEIDAIALATNAPQALRESIAKGQVDKATAVYLLNVGKQLGTETRQIAGQPGGGSNTLTPVEAEAQIAQLLPVLTNSKTSPEERKRLQGRLAVLERFANPALVERDE
jgi:hypothetical protein